MSINTLARQWTGRGALIAAALFVCSGVNAADQSQLTVGINKKLDATLFKPAAGGPYPGVLILHTSGGLQAADLEYAARLADEGYVCLVPDFFKAYGLRANTRQQTFTTYAKSIYEDLADAVEVLKKTTGIRANASGAVGFSNGGYWAMLLAARKQVQAGISYYGALNGAGSDNVLEAMRGAFRNNSAPVLVLHGAQDATVNVRFANMLADILREANAPYEMQIYPEAGHGYDRGGGGNATVSADSWARTLQFFERTLKKPLPPQ